MHLHFPVAVLLWQTSPVGHVPPHCGAGLWSQVSGMSTHPQKLVPGTGLQTSFVGHLPPHCGYVLWSQGGT